MKTLTPQKKERISLILSMSVNAATLIGKIVLAILTPRGFGRIRLSHLSQFNDQAHRFDSPRR
jgi:hypothetical protein